MVQGCDQPFCDYLITLLAQNFLLMGRLKANLELHLSQKVENDTVIAALNADDFTNLNVEVKCVNDALCAETVHFEEIAAHNQDRSWHNHQNQNVDPFYHKNSLSSTASSTILFTHLPKLSDIE